MKRLYLLIILILYYLLFIQVVYALDFQLGYNRIKPKLGTKEQVYKAESGQDLIFKPGLSETIYGNSATLAFYSEPFSYQLERIEFSYMSVIPASNPVVNTQTDVTGTITEQRMGVNYHLERELAGFYLGLGVSSHQEQVVSSSNKWVIKAVNPYFKTGMDLILGFVRIRVEQTNLKIGKHNAKINAVGLLFSF